MSNSKDKIDDFWNIDSLVPKRRTPSVFDDKHTQATEIEIPVQDNSEPVEARTEKIPESTVIKRYIHPHSAESEKQKTPDVEYSPEKSLIHSVRLYSWSSAYPYYEQFRKAAIFYYNKTVQKADHEPYFSYMPQYSQLNDKQLRFYLWFRSEIRNGRFPSVDYSYILLLIYETINLSDKLPPKKSVALLTSLWLNYREEYPRLNVQLSEWIFDMCLIERVSPPKDILALVGNSLPPSAGLREFYADVVGDANAFSDLLITHCSNYNYKKSKFAVGENLLIYKTHMRGVLAYIIERSNDPGHPFELSGLSLQDSRSQRDSYTGALCTPRVKKRIEIEFCSFSHSHELRFIVTDILKYAENRIRAHIGVKSRLSVNALPTEIKILADEYFSVKLPIHTFHPNIHDEIPEYEKLYEPVSSGLSYESASQIEAMSWETTDKLIEAFSEEADAEVLNEEFEVELTEPECEGDFISALSEVDLSFIKAALAEDFSEQGRIASSAGTLADIIADKINTFSADMRGDIILEDIGNGYVILEDYIEEIKGALNYDR